MKAILNRICCFRILRKKLSKSRWLVCWGCGENYMKNFENKGIIGVCLELKNNNYGSMLQSYATQVVLTEYGVKFELISYKKDYTPLFVIKSLPRFFNKYVLQDKLNEIKKKQFIKDHPEVKESVTKREAAFDSFREKYFCAPIVTYLGYHELKTKSEKYSAFISGSDQLWSPSGLPSNFYNLKFTYDEATRISYASSFGVKKIPWYQRSRTKDYLNRMTYISCREQSGKEIVKQLIGKNVPVVCDPTMLLTSKQWDALIGNKITTEGKYIFSYMLGGNREHRKQVEKLSEITGLPIVSIHQFLEADLNFGDIEIQDAGPVEFVNLIKNAEYVCTDSFHGSVFSIIYHKKFIIFNRYDETSSTSKNTRIDSLCFTLGLTNRRFSGSIFENINEPIDYMTIDLMLESFRNESRRYLEEALDSI